jgi:peptidoglycan hydrolase-like protein with peptidoglycan-binding domain
MASNGQLADSELSSIPGGRLRHDAANAWNAPGGPADNGLAPTGPASSYRTLAQQEELWRLYQEGRGNLAAYPGTSNHGWGIAVDLGATWMRAWIDEHGARFGWRKTEAFSEWWHVNFVGGVGPFPPPFKPLRKGSRGKAVRKYSRRLSYILRSKDDRHREDSDRRHYLHKPRRKFDVGMKRAVVLFQRDHGLKADGVIGEHTASAITAVFRKQWDERSK